MEFREIGRQNWVGLVIFWCIATVGTWLVRDHFFFWDTVQLGAKHALFFYENGFNSLRLPDSMDSGHPPLFGFGLGLCWKIFGKSLIISHLYILLFLYILIFQLWRLGNFLFGYWGGTWLCGFGLGSSVLVAQSILVSPDVVLCAFFVMGLNGILTNRQSIIAIAALGLAMTSLRGMMCVAFLWTGYLFLNRKNVKFYTENKLLFLKKFCVPFLPSAIFGIMFLGWHWWAKGWIGYFSGSSWAASFEKVGGLGILKNMVIVGWRLVDFGHIFLWLGIFYFIFHKKNRTERAIDLVGLLVISFFFLTPSALAYAGLNGHRYFLPIYILLIINFLNLVKNNNSLKIGVLIGLFSGNFWVYPQPIATGWDSTLAHVPYYSARRQMMDSLNANQFNFSEIGTSFPNWDTIRFIDLTDDRRCFARKDLSKNKYIFYSNIFNDFTKTEIETLETAWKKRWILGGGQIHVILYEK